MDLLQRGTYKDLDDGPVLSELLLQLLYAGVFAEVADIHPVDELFCDCVLLRRSSWHCVVRVVATLLFRSLVSSRNLVLMVRYNLIQEVSIRNLDYALS